MYKTYFMSLNYEYICIYVAPLVLKRPKSTYLPILKRPKSILFLISLIISIS